jgi:hypothetical protein
VHLRARQDAGKVEACGQQLRLLESFDCVDASAAATLRAQK